MENILKQLTDIKARLSRTEKMEFSTLASLHAGGSLPSPVFTRLSVVSGVPNPTSDYTAQTAVYVMPCGGGDTYPQWNGAAFYPQKFSELSVALNSSHHLLNSVYDVYIFHDAGTVRAGTGVAWSTATSRGVGAGTAELETANGVDVNKNSITIRNGSDSYTVAARHATLIGTIMPSANGQVEWSATNRGLWNAYNQMPASFITCPGYTDNNGANTYTVTSTVYAEPLSGVGTRVKFVLGKPQTCEAKAYVHGASGTGGSFSFAVGFDTTTNPSIAGWLTGSTTTNNSASISDNNKGVPLGIGAHYVAFLMLRTLTNVPAIYSDSGRYGATKDVYLSFMSANVML